MKRTHLFVLVLAALLAVLPSGAAAQGTGAAISGTVLDETKATLPGVTVTIRNTDTGARRVVVTDERGRYQAQELDPGTYEVTAELAGFRTAVRGGLGLSTGQALIIDHNLTVGGIEERVVVTGEASLVETSQSSVTHLVAEQQIRELPLNGRDFSQLTLLQPGVVATPTTNRSVDRGMGTQVSIAGARPNQISYLLDGADVNTMGNQSPGSAAGGALGVETVREFQVLTNNYSAEYGRSAGGIVSAITRSGTNTFHGSAFEFHRNDALDAKNYFAPEDEGIPPFTRNQFGGFIGGPILKDKAFFFASAEALRQDKSLTNVSRVPSRATRNRADLSAATRPYLLMYPEPNGPETGDTGLFTSTSLEEMQENYFVGKIDYQLGQNDSLSMRYSHDDADVFTPDSLGLFALTQHTLKQYFVADHKRVITSNLLNVARFAWNRPFEEDFPSNIIDVPPSLLFIPGAQLGVIDTAGLQSLGPDSQSPAFFDYKNLQVINTLTWTRGDHLLKMGFSFQRFFNDNDSTFTSGGSYRFNSVSDFVINRTNRFEGAVPGSTTDRKWRQNLFGAFVQDEFRATDRLTLNAGVRYEAFSVPTETGGRYAHFKDILDPEVTVGEPFYKNPSLLNFAPRLGFAWGITGDGRTSLRGGAGYFYEPILTNVTRTYMNRMPPYFQAANIPRPPFPSPFSSGVAVRNRLDLFQFEPETPLRIQYNLTFQREIMQQTVVTAGYLGSRGFHQIRNIEANQAIPEIRSDGSYFFPVGSTRRNPNFESMRLRATDGNSWYNGMILGASRRFSQGLMLQASYTLGKSIDEGSQAVGSGDFSNSSQPRYGWDRKDNKGPSDFDIRHNFVFNYSYELPIAQGDGGLTSALAGGWQVAGIVTLRSGVPFTPALGFDRARALPRSGGAGQRPSWAPGRNAGNAILGGPDQYFDPTAFVLPEAGTFGDVKRNELVGPGFASWDMSVNKNFGLPGTKRIQLRFEVFNILNRANFALPDTTVFTSAGLSESAGEITGTVTDARQMQLGIKFEF